MQVQIQDAEKCFDKLWLEATTNALHDAGLKSDMLNRLYEDIINAINAVKVIGRLSNRISVQTWIYKGQYGAV